MTSVAYGAVDESVPKPVQTNAATDGSAVDSLPSPATDGAGHWVIAWQSNNTLGNTVGTDNEIFAARSNDDGHVWTAPAPLNTNATTDIGPDEQVNLATDKSGTWVAVWHSTTNLGGTTGLDADILFARSTDNGATWSAPAALNTNASSDTGYDLYPTVASDGAGRWIAAWESEENYLGQAGTDYDVFTAISDDGGATWSAPQLLNTNGNMDAGDDALPTLATDGAGHWVAVWESLDTLAGTVGNDWDIHCAHSSDNGTTWSAPAALNTTAPSDTGGDLIPRVSTDGNGTWMAVWEFGADTVGSTLGQQWDIMAARSQDNGATWTAPAYLDTRGATPTSSDNQAHLLPTGLGGWIVVWHSDDTLGGTVGSDYDILATNSVDNGVTWTPVYAVNTNAATDSGTDVYPRVAQDASGNFLVTWISTDSLGNTIGTDADILYARVIIDSDGDGIPDAIEGSGDLDHDGTINLLDPDADGDGIPDAEETSADYDHDGKPNFLDTDSDNDGILDSVEGTADIDGDGQPNYLDLDSDGDGMSDSAEVALGYNPYVPSDFSAVPIAFWPVGIALLALGTRVASQRRRNG